MPLTEFFLQPADHVIDEFFAENLLLQTREQLFLDLSTLNSHTVLADAISSLRVKRTPVLRARSLSATANQCDASAAFTAAERSREKINLFLLAARQASTAYTPKPFCRFEPPLNRREELV
jgi:hypothetical protein